MPFLISDLVGSVVRLPDVAESTESTSGFNKASFGVFMGTIVITNKAFEISEMVNAIQLSSSFQLMVIGSVVGVLPSVNHLGLCNDHEHTGLLCKIVLSVAFFPQMVEWLICLPDHGQSHVLLNVRPRSIGFHADVLRLCYDG